MGTGGGSDMSTGTGPTIQLVAGQIGGMGNVDATGAAARFNNPRALAFDGGRLYVTDSRNNSVRTVDVASGAVTTLAGAALLSGTADGTGVAARFNRPNGLVTDGAGNLYIADMGNHTIRKIVIATGAVTTVAGTAGAAGSTDATGAAARFNNPHGLAWDGAGALYVADAGNLTIRKVVVASGVVTTLAGTAGMRGSVNGTGAAALFSSPHELAFHNGNLFVGDTRNSAVRQIVVASGVVTTLAGNSGGSGYVDGVGGAARFNRPRGIVADGAGTLYVADSDNNRLRIVAEGNGAVSTLAGSTYGTADGAGAGASFAGPMALAVDGAGNLYCADGRGHTIRKVVLAGAVVSTIAGAAGGDGLRDGAGAAALFTRPHGIAVDGATVYVADKQNNVVRKIDLTTNRVSTLAGSGNPGAADGVGAGAQFNGPFGLAGDGNGALYVADSQNQTIRKIDLATATVSTIAGSAQQPGGTDGTGAAARFTTPTSIAIGGGALYIGDLNNHTIRKLVLATGAVTTLAGTAGAKGSTDGTGAAARFNNPNGVALDGAGNLFVADQSNHTIRQIVLATGVVSTLAGTATMAGSSDGSGATARFDMPHALAFDGAGNLYVADTRNHTIRKVAIATGAVTTYVGNPAVGAVQLGALPGAINTPTGIAIGASGELYFATAHENAILVVK
jgi:sugar lactone lactonase YvrE